MKKEGSQSTLVSMTSPDIPRLEMLKLGVYVKPCHWPKQFSKVKYNQIIGYTGKMTGSALNSHIRQK